jgi:uncharacterized tellurite resistance protein B-like protein
MIKSLQEFFRLSVQPDRKSGSGEVDELQLAAASLLMEVARADGEISKQERRLILRLLETRLQLTPETSQRLSELAEQEVEEATSLYPFTRLVNREYTMTEKIRLIELLWQIAYADGRKCKFEEHLIRKVADLLYVPHREFIRARLLVSTAGQAG